MSNGADAVVRWRQRAKLKLVAGFGGTCCICGYNRCLQALDFHHLDPSEKDFSFSGYGATRAWSTLVKEACKCVLLCCRCHAEVHAGIITVPVDAPKFSAELAGKALPMRRRSVKRDTTYKPRAHLEKVPNRPRGKSLRELVLTSSRVAVAKKFNVSETAVRKWLIVDARAGLSAVRINGT